MRSLDLNADVGEVGGRVDASLIPLITSANIACGAHAGDPDTMWRAVRLAVQHGVAVGAHPGFFDRDGFGRRPMHLSAGQVRDLILYQVGALDAIARAEGTQVRHVKPHGALYNMAEVNRDVAAAIAGGILAYDRPLRLVGRAGSAMESAARAAALLFSPEAFADRRYRPDGSLAPRTTPGTVLEDPDAVAAQVRRLVRDGVVEADDGTRVAVGFQTLCLHGDTPGAVELAKRVRHELEAMRITLRPLDAPGT